MSKTTRHQGRVLLAMFLSAVLVGSLLLKPVHVLFVHHDRTETVHPHSNQKAISTLHILDCAICDVEFCSFIPQKQVVVPQVTNISILEPTLQEVVCLTKTSSHNFQLRAPPAAWIPTYVTQLFCSCFSLCPSTWGWWTRALEPNHPSTKDTRIRSFTKRAATQKSVRKQQWLIYEHSHEPY